jgi:hypothetical protein
MAVNERERVLFNTASAGPPISQDILEFPEEEILSLGLSLSVRRLVMIVCFSESSPRDIISAARLIFQLNGKNVGDEDDPLTSKQELSRISSELLGALRRSERVAS